MLTHGDALCMADVAYQRFRAVVRNPAWRRDFLARPLAERRRLAREVRDESERRKLEQLAGRDADIDFAADDIFSMVAAMQARPEVGVRVAWRTRQLRGGKALATQDQDITKGRIEC